MLTEDVMGKLIVAIVGSIPTTIVAFLVWKTSGKNAKQSNLIAEANLKLALYDRRYKVFSEIKSIIHQFIIHDKKDEK